MSRFFLRFLKISGIVIGSLLMLFIIFTWIVYKKKNEWLLGEIQNYVNKSQSGELKIESTDLKLLINFPNITIQLNGINYYETRDSARLKEEKPVIHADHLFIACELMPLFDNRVNIVVIDVENSELNFVKYKDGSLNIHNALKKPFVRKIPPPKTRSPKPVTKSTPAVKPKPIPAKTTPEFFFDLDHFHINELKLSWRLYSSRDTNTIGIKDFSGNFSKSDSLVRTKIKCTNELKHVAVNGLTLPESTIDFNCNLVFNTRTKLLTIEETEIKSDFLAGKLNGTYSANGPGFLDLAFDASSKDLKVFSSIIKQDAIQKHPEILKNGSIYVKGKISGSIKNKIPQFDISFGLRNLALKIPNRNAKFEKVGFDGKYISGKALDHSDAFLSITNLRGKVPGGSINGEFSIRNFANPFMKYDLSVKLDIDGYNEIFRLGILDNVKGSVSLTAYYKGLLAELKTHKMDKRRSSQLLLKDIGFDLIRTKRTVSNLTGQIITSNNVTKLDSLKFIYDNSDIIINAQIENLIYAVFANENYLVATGNIHSDQLFTKDCIFDSSGTAQVMDRASNLDIEYYIKVHPADSDLTQTKITFDIKNLSSKFDKLADIRHLSTRGVFETTTAGDKLRIIDFDATLTNGHAKITGDMLIPKSRKLLINARLKLENFPWNYIDDLSDEINTSSEPNDKNTPYNKMDIITADLDITTDLTTYPFDINQLIVRESKAIYTFPDKTSVSSDKFTMDIDHFNFIHPGNSGAIEGFKSASGNISMQHLKILKYDSFDTNIKLTCEQNKFNLDFDRQRTMSINDKGSLSIDLSNKINSYRLRYSAEGADLAAFLKKMKQRKFLDGKINYELDLFSSGNDWKTIINKINGPINLHSDSIIVYGIDLDDFLKKYKKSQNFNLTDLGAVLIAGPIGLAVTKGTDFVSLATIGSDPTHKTVLNKVYFGWVLNNSILSTSDVAVRTANNRIAFRGSINLATDSIPGITIAVVDKKGCALMDQTLYGKIGRVQAGKINIATTILGPVINSVNAVDGDACTPFYIGRVENPVRRD
jgi:uncharacterized protein involved in outer membrane biogenesis